MTTEQIMKERERERDFFLCPAKSRATILSAQGFTYLITRVKANCTLACHCPSTTSLGMVQGTHKVREECTQNSAVLISNITCFHVARAQYPRPACLPRYSGMADIVIEVEIEAEPGGATI